MKERHSYQGKLNGISGIWCDQRPEGLELTKETIFYSPDEGKIFKKGDEYFDCIIINDDVKIEDYEEVVDDRPQEIPTENVEAPVEE